MMRILLALLLFSASPCFADRPNVLLIVSDDQGYMDAGFQGGKDIPTPSLDRLARSGVRCTSGYVTHPFCSPTRAALMTGRYQQRFGHEYNPSFDPADVRQGLPLGETLLPEPLAKAGYVTGWIGKWHLGHSPAHSPLRRGFTEGFGFLGAGHHFQDWKPGPGIWDGEFNIPLQRNGRDVEIEENLTPAFGKEAAAFVTRHAEKPWFLYLAFNAPHAPHEPTAEARQRFAHIPGARGAYCAQVSLMDDAIGAVLEALDKTGQRERTLVFFFSDNGGERPGDNSPLRGYKGNVYEGGIRVPFLVSWPAKLPAGKDYDLPVSSLDVFATVLAAAGMPATSEKPLDSVDIVPFLASKKEGSPHKYLFWRTGGGKQFAIREGDWKLVRQEGQADELYNLAKDLGEKSDLAGAHPEIVQRLDAALQDWNRELIPPAFLGGYRNPGYQSPQEKKKNARGDGGVMNEISYRIHVHDSVFVNNKGGGVLIAESPGSLVERNIMIGNESGVHFRDMPRSTSKVSIIDGRSVKGEKTAIWNHDEIVRNNVFVNNTRAQVNFGINGINANRQIPERLQQQNVPGKKAPLDQATRDAAAYQDKSGVPQPAGLSLEKLNFVINGNVYWGGEAVPLMMWGGLLSYQNLKDLRATEGFEKEGVMLDPQFADPEKLDLRVPADSPLMRMGCYPRGEVPGVKLGVIKS
jgi:arylsulfatase A-like enzyme